MCPHMVLQDTCKHSVCAVMHAPPTAHHPCKHILIAFTYTALTMLNGHPRQAEEISGLKMRLSEVSSSLDTERTARALAASEAEARIAAKEAAEAKADALATENAALVQRLMDLKGSEAARLEEINRLHEEAFENAKRWQVRGQRGFVVWRTVVTLLCVL